MVAVDGSSPFARSTLKHLVGSPAGCFALAFRKNPVARRPAVRIPGFMQTIGERLLEARQRRGVSIREAAESTKVRGDYLAAMENNQFDSIQLADVYRRGFLKIYAKFLRLDAERAVNDYNALLAARNPGVARTRRGTDHELPRSIEPREPEGLDEFSSGAIEVAERPDNRRRIVLLGLASLAALILGFVLIRAFSSDSTKEETQPRAATTEKKEGEIAVFESEKAVTVSLTRDGETVPFVSKTVRPGERVTLNATGRVVLRSTGKISFTYDGGTGKFNFRENALAATLDVQPKR